MTTNTYPTSRSTTSNDGWSAPEVRSCTDLGLTRYVNVEVNERLGQYRPAGKAGPIARSVLGLIDLGVRSYSRARDARRTNTSHR